jgi:hypothetical protein
MASGPSPARSVRLDGQITIVAYEQRLAEQRRVHLGLAWLIGTQRGHVRPCPHHAGEEEGLGLASGADEVVLARPAANSVVSEPAHQQVVVTLAA